MHRVFNRGSFSRGGRFYASFQNVKKTTRRKDVTIDGRPTRELDYKSHHPNLIYRHRGLRLDGDPYDIPGFDRDIAKRGFNILVNPMTLNMASWAIAWRASRSRALRRAHPMTSCNGTAPLSRPY
jgi:hypothetical protein